MKGIKHVFFDLDHTLWDYSTNSSEALKELVTHFGISEFVTEEKFLKTYNSVNEKIWRKFNNGQIDREHIQKYRFPKVLRKLKIFIDHKPEDLNDFFIENCSSRTQLMPYTLECLTYLKEKYPMAIITNGFSDAQYKKMDSSGLNNYFDHLFISNEVGFRKPELEIYQLAMAKMNATPESSVMIGDNPKTDVRGAEKAGMKAIFYNPTGKRKSITTWEIESLVELIDIL